MLSLITPADAAQPRMRSGSGACRWSGAMPVPGDLADRTTVFAAPSGASWIATSFVRKPEPRTAAYPGGRGAQAAGQAGLVRQQRNSTVKNVHTKTCIAARIGALGSAQGGGHLGPQSARDPV